MTSFKQMLHFAGPVSKSSVFAHFFNAQTRCPRQTLYLKLFGCMLVIICDVLLLLSTTSPVSSVAQNGSSFLFELPDLF
ncbi:hypothetical protein INR49_022038 [Caranx melampygus]|nr:hypothetical protein INR49_022038 [Caranx melampygus]